MSKLSKSEVTLSDPAQVQDPQAAIDNFWDAMLAKKPSHVRQILTEVLGNHVQSDELDGYYRAARDACVRRVNTIVRMCQKDNAIFTDTEFDIETDFSSTSSDNFCLFPLKAVKTDIPAEARSKPSMPATPATEQD